MIFDFFLIWQYSIKLGMYYKNWYPCYKKMTLEIERIWGIKLNLILFNIISWIDKFQGTQLLSIVIFWMVCIPLILVIFVEEEIGVFLKDFNFVLNIYEFLIFSSGFMEERMKKNKINGDIMTTSKSKSTFFSFFYNFFKLSWIESNIKVVRR